VIYAQFGKDLFNISKVIGRKKVAQFLLTHSVYSRSMIRGFAFGLGRLDPGPYIRLWLDLVYLVGPH